MKALKVVILLVLLMCVFAFFLVPMEAGTFPTWINTDLIQFILMVLIAVIGISLIP